MAAHAVPLAAVPAGPTAPAPQVYYRTFFSDASNDPFNGSYANVLSHYGGAGITNTSPAALRQLVSNARLQRVPTAFLLQHEVDKSLHVYVQLERFETRMGLPATPWDNLMFASKGELRHNHHQTIIFHSDNFLATGRTRVATADAIDAALAADANPDIRLGPYADGDAGTEVIRTRHTCFVPAP